LNITIKMSGHVLFPSLGAPPDLGAYASAVRDVRELGNRPFVVVGGGEPARFYIKTARRYGADESTCDQVGITVANLNAAIFAEALGEDACPFVPRDFDELGRALATGKIVVMGGLQPGQSTNAVACVLAERSRSELLINTTTVDGIYSSDPKADPSARRFESISAADVARVLEHLGSRAGEYDLLDPVALKLIQRSKITTRIIDGREPTNIVRAARGEAVGTAIIP